MTLRHLNYYIWKATGSTNTDEYDKWWNTEQEMFDGKKPSEVSLEEHLNKLYEGEENVQE
jgi:hypothetical protein